MYHRMIGAHFSPMFAAVFVLTAVSQVKAAQPAAQDTSFVEVTGHSQISVTPDRARLSFAVETEAETAREAAEQNAALMDAVIRALRTSDAPGLEIETYGYSLNPKYRRRTNEQTQRIDGYRAQNHVRVTILDVNGVGELIDLGVGAGANRIAGLSFDVQDPDAARLEVLERAVMKARAEAQVIADVLGITLGMPLEVRGGAQTPMPIFNRSFESVAVADFAATPTPIEAGSQTITANVMIRFRLTNGGG